MHFFISDALASTPTIMPAQGSPYASILMIVAMVGLFYFIAIRPNTQRRKKHDAMVGGLGVGDEIVTNGGVMGKVVTLADDYMMLNVAENVDIRIQRGAIFQVLPKGTLKSL